MYALPVNQLSAKKIEEKLLHCWLIILITMWTPSKQMIFRYATINYMCGTLATYWFYFYTKSSDMLNKNTLGVKKYEAKKKQHCE